MVNYSYWFLDGSIVNTLEERRGLIFSLITFFSIPFDNGGQVKCFQNLEDTQCAYAILIKHME